MKAAIFEEHGGPEVVRVADVETPEPGPGEVRIRVEAASMNHLDLWTRRGLPIEITMPHIGGSDIAGVVDEVGPGVDAAVKGLRVVVDPSLDYLESYARRGRGENLPSPDFRLLGEHTQGGFAEYAVVPRANLVEIPEGFGHREAAAAGLCMVTAWRGLVSRGRLQAGERILITGASGGVSTCAVQIARLAGAEVHAVTSGPENVERVAELGADVVYDRLDVDWGKEVWRETGKEGVDLVLDSVGEKVWKDCVRALAVKGRMVSYGATTGARGEADIRQVFWKQLSILGTTMGTPEEFRTVMGLVFRGKLSPVIHETLPLAEIQRAHEMLEEGEVFGKLVMEP